MHVSFDWLSFILFAVFALLRSSSQGGSRLKSKKFGH